MLHYVCHSHMLFKRDVTKPQVYLTEIMLGFNQGNLTSVAKAEFLSITRPHNH